MNSLAETTSDDISLKILVFAWTCELKLAVNVASSFAYKYEQRKLYINKHDRHMNNQGQG